MQKFAIGIDLGGTFIKGGVVSEGGELIVKDEVPTQVFKGPDGIVENIVNLCNSLIASAKIKKEQVIGVGVGSPGLVDGERGIAIHSSNLNFNHYPLAQRIGESLGIYTKITNDANAAALGEAIFGAGKEYGDSVMITLGTGVGGGIVINRKVYEGNQGAGAEIGHMIIKAGGELCSCGKRGCFEAYSSATALIRDTKRAMQENKTSLMWEVGIDNVNGKTAFDYYESDQTAKSVVDEYLYMLSIGLVNIANVFRPEAIIISGGISRQPGIEKPLHKLVNENKFAGDKGPEVKVLVATLRNDAGTFGAAALFL